MEEAERVVEVVKRRRDAEQEEIQLVLVATQLVDDGLLAGLDYVDDK